jgi:DNA-binding NarL/FixJ family response regulator
MKSVQSQFAHFVERFAGELDDPDLAHLIHRIHQNGGRIAKVSSGKYTYVLCLIETSWQSALTRREQEIAFLLTQALTYRDIGQHLGITEGTVKVHIRNIFKKLKVYSRMELARQIFPVT